MKQHPKLIFSILTVVGITLIIAGFLFFSAKSQQYEGNLYKSYTKSIDAFYVADDQKLAVEIVEYQAKADNTYHQIVIDRPLVKTDGDIHSQHATNYISLTYATEGAMNHDQPAKYYFGKLKKDDNQLAIDSLAPLTMTNTYGQPKQVARMTLVKEHAKFYDAEGYKNLAEKAHATRLSKRP
ncbi:hypothetical protein [Lacticaseibacillus porcinae]|uniref:hypothetical protein n=1 Tax=Lacticaseibacillus porcinae TaxID=1123687 RepID=UPI000F7AE4CE|nr:hypothetical protein [Lacticaseibacillus porcinae]